MEEKNENLSCLEPRGPWTLFSGQDSKLFPGSPLRSPPPVPDPGSLLPPECCALNVLSLILLLKMRHMRREGGFVLASHPRVFRTWLVYGKLPLMVLTLSSVV